MADKHEKIENFLKQLDETREINIKPSNNSLKGLKLLNECLKYLPINRDKYFFSICKFIKRILSIDYKDYLDNSVEVLNARTWIKSIHDTVYHLLQSIEKFNIGFITSHPLKKHVTDYNYIFRS